MAYEWIVKCTRCAIYSDIACWKVTIEADSTWFVGAERFYSDLYVASVSFTCVTRGNKKRQAESQIRDQMEIGQRELEASFSIAVSTIYHSQQNISKYLPHHSLHQARRAHHPAPHQNEHLLLNHPQRPNKSTTKRISQPYLNIPNPLHLDQKVHNPSINNIPTFLPSSVQPISKCITAVLPIVFVP